MSGIVFDPAGMRVVLGEFLLRAGDHAAIRVEHQRPRGRGALIEREDKPGHYPSPPLAAIGAAAVSCPARLAR
jgi:hypothetical protein